MDTDTNYEFNAPQYIDFLNDAEMENLDDWFDENPGHEGGVRISQIGPYIQHHSNFKQATSAISAALESAIEESLDENSCPGPADNPPKSSVTSGSEGLHVEAVEGSAKIEHCVVGESRVESPETQREHRRSTFTACEPISDAPKIVAEPSKQEKIHSVPTIVAVPRNLVTSWEGKGNHNIPLKPNGDKGQENGRNQSQKTRRSDSDLKRKSPVVKNDAKRKGSSQTQRKSVETGNRKRTSSCMSTPDVQDSSSEPSEKKQKMQIRKPLLTISRTPTLMKRLRSKPGQAKKTTEDLELEKINKLREETKVNLKKNTSYLKKALAAVSYGPTRSATEITKPVEFHFATDSRIKPHPMVLRNQNAEKDFQDQLRKHPPSPTFKKSTTKVVPFSFQSDARISKSANGEQSSQRWESMASAVTNFYARTPDRCRSKPGAEQNDGPRPQNTSKPKLTHPKTPQLISRNRSRPVTVPSRDQLEEKEVEEMKSYTFKAREFDRRLVDAEGMYGVKKQPRAPVTEVKPFNFESDNRIDLRKQKDGLIEEEELNTTKQKCPKSTHQRPKSTDVKPFSFEERNKLLIARKEEKIKKIIQEEEKAREFHARPLPSFSPDLPEVEKKPTTDPKPFHLSMDTKGVEKLEKWNEKIQREQQEERERMEFKAQPAKVLYEEAFVPKPSCKPLTDVSGFRLNTEERSKLREEYESKKKEQERLMEEELQERLKEQEEEEQRNVRVLRSQMVHHANPIRNYKAVEFTGSDKPVTVPKTPNFETTKRLGRSIRV